MPLEKFANFKGAPTVAALVKVEEGELMIFGEMDVAAVGITPTDRPEGLFLGELR